MTRRINNSDVRVAIFDARSSTRTDKQSSYSELANKRPIKPLKEAIRPDEEQILKICAGNSVLGSSPSASA